MAQDSPDSVDGEKALKEYLAILDEHREECVASGKYDEADVALKRLETLREQDKQRRTEAVRTRHIAERLDVEEAHMREFEVFTARWDDKMREFDERTALLDEAMREKHAEELRTWQETMQNQFLLRPKFSRDLLNLRSIEDTLAKQKKYSEASKVKQKADVMEKWELENLKKGWRRKFLQKQQNFVSKQQQEREAFKKRIEAGRQKQQRVRHEKLCCVLQRYNNIKMGLSRQQNLEAIRENKALSPKTKRAQTARKHQSSMYLNPRVDYLKTTPLDNSKAKTQRLAALSRDPPAYTNKLSTVKTRAINNYSYDKRVKQEHANTISGSHRKEKDVRNRVRKRGPATRR